MNSMGSAHGAALIMWADLMTMLAVTAFDLKSRSHAPVDMNVNFISSARKGEKILIKAIV